jgi:gamma-glutamyltranspeptidase / glutathione hydrolase
MADTYRFADSLDRPFPSRRSAVMGLGPVVATSQPLAAQVGLRIMLDGGNAFDAAVATAAMLSVVEPTSTGMGGDCFALLFLTKDRTIHAPNGSGRSPLGMPVDVFRDRGMDRVPERGILSVTVPGAVDGWATLVETHGRMPLADVLAPAIATAERGYPVSELIADAWRLSESLLAGQVAARKHFLPGGRAPRPGEIVRLPALGRSLRLIAEGGREAFYRGPIAEAIVATSDQAGGFFTRDDFARHRSMWNEPIGTDYGGMHIWECPPNGQGLAALLALAVTRGFDLSAVPWGSPDHLHPLVEAMRLGFADAHAWVADPDFAPAPLDELLTETYAARRRAQIHPDRALIKVGPGLPGGSDTVYLATVDAEGNACSFIGSNYMGFGSGLVAGDTGIPLQNRGAGFVLQPGHPNVYAPGKRPYHTIIPALATRPDGSLHAVFGVMGGHMQPQGHLQVAVNMWAYDLDPQRALDAPRFQLTPDGRLALEPWFDDQVRSELARRGHDVVPRDQMPPPGTFGGGQIIVVTEDGVRIAGSDPRKDGQAVAGA